MFTEGWHDYWMKRDIKMKLRTRLCLHHCCCSSLSASFHLTRHQHSASPAVQILYQQPSALLSCHHLLTDRQFLSSDRLVCQSLQHKAFINGGFLVLSIGASNLVYNNIQGSPQKLHHFLGHPVKEMDMSASSIIWYLPKTSINLQLLTINTTRPHTFTLYTFSLPHVSLLYLFKGQWITLTHTK